MADLLTMPSLTIPDASARAEALDITRSFIVEAPAGSGKTALLIQRFLALLADETVTTPAQVLAITFTRKATAELQDRILSQLRAAQDRTSPANNFDHATRPLALAVLARDRALDWQILDHPDRLNVRTIDSLALDIASGLPLLSNSGGTLAPSLDPEPLYAEAAARTLNQLGGSDARVSDAIKTVLLHRDGNLANCQTLIATMLAQRDQWGELIPLGNLDDELLDAEVLPRLEAALDVVICQGLSGLTRAIPSHILEELTDLASEMAEAEGYKGAASPIAICRDRNRPPQEKAEDLEHWRAIVHLLVKPSKPRDWRRSLSVNHIGFGILKHHQTQLKRILDELSIYPDLVEELCRVDALPPANYPADQWPTTKALFHVLSQALAELQLVFAERNTCDFAELGLLARTALRADSALDDLRAAANMDLQHLLVDEMQDTSSAQYELLQLLTQRWDGHSQTVFLVGDPKQSIYLFRQARVERFIQTLHTGRLTPDPDSLTLNPLHLSANFRSQRVLVEDFNRDFTQIFPSVSVEPEQVTYYPVQATRDPALRGTTWHKAVLPYSADQTVPRRAQRHVHAREIRKVIEEFRQRPLPPNRTEPWRIAVLVRQRLHLFEIVNALKRGPAIPYRAIEIEPLGERHEILDLIALTRALLHPADRTAWLALLRSPWCGLTLADLHLLAGQDDQAFQQSTILHLIETRGDLLSNDGIDRLSPFWTVISEAVKQRGQMPLSQWVHQTWRAFNTHLYASKESLSSVERYLQLLDELEDERGQISLPHLEQRLKRLYAAATVHPGAVDLMTIHGAKGLEWDLVLVPGLERVGQSTIGRLLDWIEIDGSSHDAAPGIVAPIRGKGGAVGKLNEWMRSLSNAREAAERQRLFYVACTRAREELHLFATLEQNSAGEARPKSGSLLASAWAAAEGQFAATTPKVIQMPNPIEPGTFAIAASAEESRIIHRTPAPPFALTAPSAPQAREGLVAARAGSVRPEGSFAARAFGNAVHALLELLATRLAAGESAAAILLELADWPPRITTLLRASGLATHEVERFAASILRALTATLSEPIGLWLLSPRARAVSESALISYAGEERSSIRLDRSFLAGSTPLSEGETHLWIVDYKTANHGAEGLEEFLEQQRESYRPQLENYARELAGSHPIRLALFYPMLQRLLWWDPEAGPEL